MEVALRVAVAEAMEGMTAAMVAVVAASVEVAMAAGRVARHRS